MKEMDEIYWKMKTIKRSSVIKDNMEKRWRRIEEDDPYKSGSQSTGNIDRERRHTGKNERRRRNSGNVFILERCREIRYGKGKQQGKLSVVLIQLKKLLGKLTPDLEMKIVNSKEETLDSIIIHIFEIHNEEDVLKYIYKWEKCKMK